MVSRATAHLVCESHTGQALVIPGPSLSSGPAGSPYFVSSVMTEVEPFLNFQSVIGPGTSFVHLGEVETE